MGRCTRGRTVSSFAWLFSFCWRPPCLTDTGRTRPTSHGHGNPQGDDDAASTYTACKGAVLEHERNHPGCFPILRPPRNSRIHVFRPEDPGTPWESLDFLPPLRSSIHGPVEIMLQRARPSLQIHNSNGFRTCPPAVAAPARPAPA